MSLDNTIGIVDVVEFEVQQYGTRDLLFSADYATKVGLSSEAERLDIRGGINAPIRISVDHSPKADFSSELPLVSLDALGAKLGKTITKAAVTAPKSEILYVSATNTISLAETPLDSTLKVYVLETNERDRVNELTAGTPATTETEYSIATKDITVHTSVVEGTPIKVVYDYTTGAGAKRVRVTAKDFPGFVRITGRGYALDESGGKAPVSFIVHKCKPTPGFALNFESGAATNIPFDATMFPDKVDGEEVFYDLIPLPDEQY